MTLRVGFFVDQIAGHVTNYRNLRRAAEGLTDFDASWHEIRYDSDGGMIGRVRNVLPSLPSYATGITRATWQSFKPAIGQRFDAIFTNTSVGVFFGPFYRRVPTLIDFDSTPMQIDSMEAYTTDVDPALVAKLKWLVTRDMYDAATVLQCWSNWAKNSVVRDYGISADKIVINPPGINLDFWKPNVLRREHRPGEPLRVLFVGGDFRRKGGEQMLEWYRTQSPAEVELHLVTREEVATQPGVTVYHNIQPNSAQLIDLYQRSDLFILPSLGECFGIATIEAMGAGLPVIATSVGGTADIIEPERNGYIISARDVHALGTAISRILGDAELRTRMGAQSRIMAEERFDLHRNAKRTFDFLHQIAQQRPRAPFTHAEGIYQSHGV